MKEGVLASFSGTQRRRMLYDEQSSGYVDGSPRGLDPAESVLQEQDMAGEHPSGFAARHRTPPLPPAVTRHGNGGARGSGEATTLLGPFVASDIAGGERTPRTFAEADRVATPVMAPAEDTGVAAEPHALYAERDDASNGTPTLAEPEMTGGYAAPDGEWVPEEPEPMGGFGSYEPAEATTSHGGVAESAGGSADASLDEVLGIAAAAGSDPAARIADMLQALADDMRRDTHGALERRIGGANRLDALVAAIIAGYLAGQGR
jgi:hypothetical protein